MANILIVDDDLELRSSLSKALKFKGYHTDEASSGQEALEKVTSEDFDIVLLDLLMPDTGGMDVLRDMRRIKPSTKEIIMTGFATIDNAVEAIKRGAYSYIAKPFSINDLDAMLKRCLEESRFDMSVKDIDLDFVFGALSNSMRRNIIKLLHKHNSMHLMKITRILDIDDHTKVLFHLKMLKDSELIHQDKKRSYSLTKEGVKTLNYLKMLENHLSE